MKPPPVYEVARGQPAWSRLSRLAAEHVSRMATAAVKRAKDDDEQLEALRTYFAAELPPAALLDVLRICVAGDRFRCRHNPTDCLAIQLWRVFYSEKHADVNVVHHEFAFPKTSNYPEIVHNLDAFLGLVLNTTHATTTSFKLELKQCEIGFLLEDKIGACLSRCGADLRVLEIPGLASDPLLDVIALNCTNLESLSLKGSREQVTDGGFARFAETALCRNNIKRLDVSRCGLSNAVLLPLKLFESLVDLKVSTTLLDDVPCPAEGAQSALTPTMTTASLALPTVNEIMIENDSYVQVSINRVMTLLRNVFPAAKNIQLVNCIACELHVTLTQHPTNITYMRETIQTLELISADYFNFPRLVYPCPNLESLCIEKPSNDVFNIDQQNVPFLYGNTVPFINLKHLKLSRISLTNLPHFLSKSRNLRKFKVTNIGRRERPRWNDARVRQILPPESVPFLEEFHVSCLPNEGFSTATTAPSSPNSPESASSPESMPHRYLHLTKATVQYLTENFSQLKSIAGIESWKPDDDCNWESLNALLNADGLSGKFSVTSI